VKFRGVLGGHALVILVATYQGHSLVPMGGEPFNHRAHPTANVAAGPQ
jgi:hypothetical protein